MDLLRSASFPAGRRLAAKKPDDEALRKQGFFLCPEGKSAPGTSSGRARFMAGRSLQAAGTAKNIKKKEAGAAKVRQGRGEIYGRAWQLLQAGCAAERPPRGLWQSLFQDQVLLQLSVAFFSSLS